MPEPEGPHPRKVSMDVAMPAGVPFPAHQVLAGNPLSASAPLVSTLDDGFSACVWTCTPGTFRWFYNSDEIAHILEGEATITSDHGAAPFRATVGDVLYFPSNSSGVWEIHSTIRKLAYFRSHTDDFLGRLRSAVTQRKR